MTIVTKVTEKKENEENKEKELMAAKTAGGEGTETDVEVGTRTPVTWNGTEMPVEWYLAWRRRRLLTSLCAGLLILWLLMAAIIGGILLFRYLHRRPVFYGWCGTEYVDEESRAEKLQERVEIDPNYEYEKIEVPRFGPNRPAVFVHDFRQNLTAIVDLLGDQCFVKRLDRQQISPPTSFIDLVKKMESGYYEQNTALVREHYRVRLPSLSEQDIADLGSWMIEQQCIHKTSFMLDKEDHSLERPDDRRKRSADACKSYKFYNGKDTVVDTVIC